jgi:hypothetical protein
VNAIFFQNKIIFLILIGLIVSCKPSSKVKTTSKKDTAPKVNNVVAAKNINSEGINSHTEIKFEGSNNLFELINKNSFYFNEDHDVIIIKGNNTIIRLINENVLDIGNGQRDTLVIVGSNRKYVVDMKNSFSINNKKAKVDTIQLKETYSEYDNDEPSSLYAMAESYLFGTGQDQSTKKAIELYEFAAAKNHIPSLEKLGYIYTGKFGAPRDKMKSLYYYKRGSSLGDDYCNLQIKIHWGQ